MVLSSRRKYGIVGAVGLLILLGASSRSRPPKEIPPPLDEQILSIRASALLVDNAIRGSATAQQVALAPVADDFVVLRRLMLGLCGTIPSLAEIRIFESLSTDERLERWTQKLVADTRFHDYFAERFTRAFAPNMTAEPFFTYRRRRFKLWLSEQWAQRRPYDELVREMVSSEGVWNDRPATNFITGHDRDPIRLTTRGARAFLGIRLDCAQCHDHPFADWKQEDFKGLAAFFGQTELGLFGIRDHNRAPSIVDPTTQKRVEVEPRVPFLTDLVPEEGRNRERLAHWLTHQRNPYFARSIVNRVWGLVFGRPMVEPVDDIPEAVPAALEILSNDFRAHGFDIQRLVRVITNTEAFHRVSGVQSDVSLEQENLFAAFPISRLRPDQSAAAVVQISSLRTFDKESHPLFRLIQWANINDYSERFGDPPNEEELENRGGTVPQRLLMMNGKIVRDRLEATPFSAAGRLSGLSPDEETCVRLTFLVCLTRPPHPEEFDYFTEKLRGLKNKARGDQIEDMIWALVNSTEFSWNH